MEISKFPKQKSQGDPLIYLEFRINVKSQYIFILESSYKTALLFIKTTEINFNITNLKRNKRNSNSINNYANSKRQILFDVASFQNQE